MRHSRVYRSRYIFLILFLLIFLCYVYDGFNSSVLLSNDNIFSHYNYKESPHHKPLIYTFILTINSSLLVTYLISYCITNIFSKSYDVQHLFLWVVLLIHYTCLIILDITRHDTLKFGVCLRAVNMLIIYLCTALGLQTIVSVICTTLAIEFIFFYLSKSPVIDFILKILVINLFHLIGILMYCQMYFRTIDTLHCEVFSLARFLNFVDFQIITQKADVSSYPEKHEQLCIKQLFHILFIIRNNCIKFIAKLKRLGRNNIKKGIFTETNEILGSQHFFSNKNKSLQIYLQIIFQYVQFHFGWYNIFQKIKISFFGNKLRNNKKPLNTLFCSTCNSNVLEKKIKENFDCSQKNKQILIDDTKNSSSFVTMKTSDTATWSNFPIPANDSNREFFKFPFLHVFKNQYDKCHFSNSLVSLKRHSMSYFTSDDSLMNSTIESKPTHFWNNLFFYVQIFVSSCKSLLNIHNKHWDQEKKNLFLTNYPNYYQCLKKIQRNYIDQEVIGFRSVGFLGTPTSNWIWKRMITSALYIDKNIRMNDSSLCYGLYGNLPFQFSLASPERTSSISTTSSSYKKSHSILNKQKSYANIHVDQESNSNSFYNCKNLLKSLKKNDHAHVEKNYSKPCTELNEIIVQNQGKFFDETETVFCENCKYHDLNHALELYAKIARQRKKIFTEGDILHYEQYNTNEKEKQEKDEEEEEEVFSSRDDPSFQYNDILKSSCIPTTSYRTDWQGYKKKQPLKRLQLLESVCMTPSRNKSCKLRQEHKKHTRTRRQGRLLKYISSTNNNDDVTQFKTNAYSSQELGRCERGCKNICFQDYSFDEVDSSFSEEELPNFEIVHTALEKSTNVFTTLKSFFMPRIRNLSNIFFEYIWIFVDTFYLDQFLHMILCCNFVLEAGSWHNKAIIPKNTILCHSLENCKHGNEYGQWVTLINLELRYIRGCVQLLGTIMNLFLIAIIFYSTTILHCFRSYTPNVIKFPFYGGFFYTSNISTNCCSPLTMKYIFFFCWFFLIFSLLEVILIISQILVWKLYSWNITDYVAEILDFERFSISLICLCHHATHRNNDFEIYTLMLLNIALSAIFHPFSSTRFGVVLALKIVLVNIFYMLSVAHLWSVGSWERQWLRLNILLIHECLIIFMLFVRADEECLRRTFCVFIFPYLLQLSYLIKQPKQSENNENDDLENEQLCNLKSGVTKCFSISYNNKALYNNQTHLKNNNFFFFPELQSFYKDTKI